MSQVANTSNENSALWNTLNKGAEDETLYEARPSVVNSFNNDLVKVSPDKALSTSAQTLNYQIPAMSMLKNAYLKVTVGHTSGVQSGWFLPYLFKDGIRLLAHGQEIERLSPEAIIGWIEEQPYNLRKNLEVAAGKTGGDAVTAFTGYLPLPFSFYNNPKLFLDSRFLEAMTIEVKKVANADVTVGGTDTFTVCDLYCNFVTLSESAWMEHVNNQYGDNKPLTQLRTTYANDASVAAAHSGTASVENIKLNVRGLVKKSYIMVRNETAAADAAENDYAEFAKISKVTIRGSGRTIYDDQDAFGNMLMNSMIEVPVSNALQTYAQAESEGAIYVLDWSLVHDKLVDRNSGAISFSSITNPELDIEFTATTDTNSHSVQVAHQMYYTSVIDPKNGSISIGSRA